MFKKFLKTLALALYTSASGLAVAHPAASDGLARIDAPTVARQVEVGDIVFIRVPSLLFRKVADANGSWTNHVGIVINTDTADPEVAESRFPLSGVTSLSRFAERSEDGRLAVRRLATPPSPAQQEAMTVAARSRTGRWYDLGFNLQSSREFCSKFVREVVLESTGLEVGKVQQFSELVAQQPQADQQFWRWWFFGHIPWQRSTVTPASQLESDKLVTIFDGRIVATTTRFLETRPVTH